MSAAVARVLHLSSNSEYGFLETCARAELVPGRKSGPGATWGAGLACSRGNLCLGADGCVAKTGTVSAGPGNSRAWVMFSRKHRIYCWGGVCGQDRV